MSQIYEFNACFAGKFARDARGGDDLAVDKLVSVVYAYIDYNKARNMTLRELYGNQSLKPDPSSWSPNVRIRPILIDTNSDDILYAGEELIGYLAGGAGKPRCHVVALEYQNANFLGDLATLANMMRVPTITSERSFIFDDPVKFKYHWRQGISFRTTTQLLWGYFKYFGWRQVSLLYSVEEVGLNFNEGFLEEVGSDPDFRLVRTVPLSFIQPYQRELITANLLSVLQDTTRLVYVCISLGIGFQPRHNGALYADLVADDMRSIGLWTPAYQIVLTEEYFVSNTFESLQATATEESDSVPNAHRFHFVVQEVTRDMENQARFFATLFNHIGMRLLNPEGLCNYTIEHQDYFGLNLWEPSDTFATRALPLLPQSCGRFPGSDIIYQDLLHLDLMYVLGSTFYNVLMAGYTPENVTVEAMMDGFLNHVTGTEGSILDTPGRTFLPDRNMQGREAIWQFCGLAERNPCHPGVPGWAIFPILRWRSGDDTWDPFGVEERGIIPVWANGAAGRFPPPILRNCSDGMFENENGVCEWCRAGTYNAEFDATGCIRCAPGSWSSEKAPNCTNCTRGFSAEESGSDECRPCSLGTFAAGEGSSSCSLCERGKWLNLTAYWECFPCASSLDTATEAAKSESACLCPLNNYAVDATTCVECTGEKEGLDCETNWPDTWMTQPGATPILLKGYYSLASQPLEVYLCKVEEDCPGGPPETCAGTLQGLVCTECRDSGQAPTDAGCKDCPPLLNLLLLVTLVACIALIVAAYYLSNGLLAVNADNPQAVFLFVGLVVTAVQIFGVLKGLAVPWPKAVFDIFDGSSSVVTLDASTISLQCAVGNSPIVRYLFQVVMPFLVMILGVFCFFCSRGFYILGFVKTPWSVDKTVNAIGQILQALFIAFAVIIVRPFQCYTHPSKKRSVSLFPAVICNYTSDHLMLALLSLVVILFFLLPFTCWSIYGVWTAPRKSQQKELGHLQRLRFLLYRFRPDWWWWGLVFMFRQTCIAFSTVVPAEQPHAQLFYTGGILCCYLAACCRAWPWISSELSTLDCGSTLLLLLMCLSATQFVPDTVDLGSQRDGRVAILVCVLICLVSLFAWYAIVVLHSVYRSGLWGEFAGSYPDRSHLSKKFWQWLQEVQLASKADIVEAICSMNSFDRHVLANLIQSWRASNKTKGTDAVLSRLQNLPSRQVFSTRTIDDITRSMPSAKASIDPSSATAEVEHNTHQPYTFKIHASKGVATIFPRQ